MNIAIIWLSQNGADDITEETHNKDIKEKLVGGADAEYDKRVNHNTIPA